MIKSFRDLEVYKESFQLQIEVEDELGNYPRQEQYLLTDQTRRSCRAIPALLAEGWSKRESIKEFQKFLRDATAEVNEMINHLLLATHKGYIKNEGFIGRYEKLGGKLTNLKNNWQVFKTSKNPISKSNV